MMATENEWTIVRVAVREGRVVWVDPAINLAALGRVGVYIQGLLGLTVKEGEQVKVTVTFGDDEITVEHSEGGMFDPEVARRLGKVFSQMGDALGQIGDLGRRVAEGPSPQEPEPVRVCASCQFWEPSDDGGGVCALSCYAGGPSLWFATSGKCKQWKAREEEAEQPG